MNSANQVGKSVRQFSKVTNKSSRATDLLRSNGLNDDSPFHIISRLRCIRSTVVTAACRLRRVCSGGGVSRKAVEAAVSAANGANGMSDIEGKVAKEAMSEWSRRASGDIDGKTERSNGQEHMSQCGQGTSFKRIDTGLTSIEC